MENYVGKICTALAALALCGSAFGGTSQQTTITLYVGRHFEIRDHEQPTKYVFNGATRVAEITGSLSANLRIQRLRLYPGWNLCSLAVSGPFPATGAEAIWAAYQWNTGTGDYSQVTLGQTLAAGTVLWLKATTNAAVSVLGTYTDPAPQQVQAGGTYVSGAGLEAWSPALPDSASSWEFAPEAAQWSDHLAGGLAAISDPPPILSPGEAFYLQSAATVSLEIPDPTLRIRYYHEDHLGSSSVITDASGALVEEAAFYPFGHPRNEYEPRQSHDPYQFTQKERDRESGLHYFEARYLAGALSRFITADIKYANPDTLGSGEFQRFLSNSQEINLYSYAGNNPIRYLDPTGLGFGAVHDAERFQGEEKSEPLEDAEKASEAAGTAGTTVEVAGKAVQAVEEFEKIAKVGGPVLHTVAVGVEGYKLWKHPNSRNASEFSWTVSKTAISVVNPVVGLLIQGGDLVGLDVGGHLNAAGSKIGTYLADQPSMDRVMADYAWEKQYQEKWQETKKLRAYIAAEKDWLKDGPKLAEFFRSIGKNQEYLDTRRTITQYQEDIQNKEAQIHRIWQSK